jgi:hypothetical protein
LARRRWERDDAPADRGHRLIVGHHDGLTVVGQRDPASKRIFPNSDLELRRHVIQGDQLVAVHHDGGNGTSAVG